MACGCAPGSDTGGVTQVAIRVDAEATVASLAAGLHIRTAQLQQLPQPESPPEPDPEGWTFDSWAWPVEVQLKATDSARYPYYWLEAQTVDVLGRPQATVRRIGSFEANASAQESLRLLDRCLDLLCGNRTQTCSDAGGCQPAARTP